MDREAHIQTMLFGGNDGQPPMAKGRAAPQAASGYALVGDGFYDLGHVGQDTPSAAQNVSKYQCG